MSIQCWRKHTLALLAACALAACSDNPQSTASEAIVSNTTVSEITAESAVADLSIQQIRNATLKLNFAGTTFLVDPMLADKGAYPGFRGTYNEELRNPLVDLPIPVTEVMEADAVIVTHRHLDHWDEAARQQLPKDIPIFVQNEADAQATRAEGFTDVRVIGPDVMFGGVTLSKTGGQHGDETMSARLGEVMGVVFQHPQTATVYIAGDTIWSSHVDAAISGFQPDIIILNTGYARFQGFDGSIIMGKEDLARAYQAAPGATLIGSHMEAVNHAMQTRQELREYIAEQALDPARVLVPEDGEIYRF